ncbi:MAG: hypothetical protein GY814_09035 [Gammaproteobacteria bacterium]|nr:hypothetical protein [Gammaproteobacteria bacterium]
MSNCNNSATSAFAPINNQLGKTGGGGNKTISGGFISFLSATGNQTYTKQSFGLSRDYFAKGVALRGAARVLFAN